VQLPWKPSGKPGIALGGQKCWETHRKPSNASGGSQPGNPVVSLEFSWDARNAGKPIESPIMLLRAEILESQQEAQKCFWGQSAWKPSGKPGIALGGQIPKRLFAMLSPGPSKHATQSCMPRIIRLSTIGFSAPDTLAGGGAPAMRSHVTV